MMDDAAPRVSFPTRYRKVLLGSLSVVLFFAAWQAIFLLVPFNPLFISKPSLIASGLVDLITSGDLLRDLAVSAVPFLYGFSSAFGLSSSAFRSASSWAGACVSVTRSIR